LPEEPILLLSFTPMNERTRREFLSSVATLLGAAVLPGEAWAGGLSADARPGEAGRMGSMAGAEPYVGIQMSPHTLLYEGINPCLDLIKRTAAVNAVYPYSHAFHTSSLGQPVSELASDHGKPARDFRQRVPMVWVKHHDEYFKDTVLRIRQTDPGLEFADRDLFREIVEPARQRGMTVCARILEGSGRAIENFETVLTVDVYGRRGVKACWSHPDYRNFWNALVADMFHHYDLDGLQWGAERMGPLMNVILPWNNDPPACFCVHCSDRGKAAGIDPERAKEGYRKLYEYVQQLRSNAPKPAEGVYTVFLRHLIRYPEILSWQYQYRLSREAVHKGMYDTIKAIKPSALVGWHVDQQPASWDIVYRAEMSYEEMAPYSDYIKLILYHEVLGPRIRSWYLDRFKSTILSELSLEESLNLYYDVFGYDKKAEPKLDELMTKGFSPDFVYRETKRSVASANGKTRIFAGIGFDVPGSPPDDPERIYQATVKAFEGGAAGIMVSREYEEMRVAHLEAVGRAVRDWGRSRGAGG
jgi:hypothetical protein